MADTPLSTDWVAKAAASRPEAVALVDDDGTALSYAALDALTAIACDRWRDAGVAAGDIGLVRVGRVDRHLIADLWAAWRLGAIPLVVDQESPLLTQSPELLDEWLATPVSSAHTIVLTSGSGGNPRPVRITADNVTAAVAVSCERLGNGADDRWLLVLPLFHIGGLSVLWRSAAAGGCVVLQSRFDEGRVVSSLRNREVDIASFVPTMLFRVLEADPGPYVGIKAVLLGGAAAQRELVERGLAAGLPILQTYGTTETCSQVATVAPGEGVASLGSAGRPLAGVTVTTGEAGVGEIVVSGPTVSPGYLGEEDREGGHHTGDIGYLDENGRLVILGRVDDMIATGGEKVYPQRVAEELTRSDMVATAEVVAVPDPEWGHALVAVVVGDEAERSRLEEWARRNLPRHALPKHWIFLEELPMLAGGKVNKMALADLARRANWRGKQGKQSSAER